MYRAGLDVMPGHEGGRDLSSREGPIVCRLPAGASRIRTPGPTCAGIAVKRRNRAILGGDHEGNGKIQDRAPCGAVMADRGSAPCDGIVGESRRGSRSEKIGPVADFTIVHCFSELVTAAGKPRRKARFTSPNAGYSRPAVCGLPIIIPGAPSAIGH